jgi:hypothetical protein
VYGPPSADDVLADLFLLGERVEVEQSAAVFGGRRRRLRR